MKLLFTQKDLPERSVGGAERHAWDLAREFAQRHEVTVFCGGRGLPARGVDDRVDGVRVVAMPSNVEVYRGSPRERALVERFTALLEAIRPEVVHFEELYRLSTELPQRARRASAAPLVCYTLHEFYAACSRLVLLDADDRRCEGPQPRGCLRCARRIASERYPADVEGLRRRGQHFAARRRTEIDLGLRHPRWRRSLVEAVDHFVCTSLSLRERMIAFGLPAARLHHIPGGISGEALAPRPPGSPLRFAFVGSPAPHKGIFTLLAAARLAPEISIDIWGEPPANVAAALLERAAGLPGLRLRGNLEEAHKRGTYEAIDVLVTPSRWVENQPLTMLEAHRFGTPVLASDLGGMAEMLAGGGGWLVAPDDPEALAAAFRRLNAAPAEVVATARAIPPVATVADHAAALEALYAKGRR